MIIEFTDIKKNYPKTFEKFKRGTFEEHIFLDNLYLLIEDDNKNKSVVCYCDVERFFDYNGIEIYVIVWRYKKEYRYFIETEGGEIESIVFKTRQEAKEKAILKAFEILEKRVDK